MLEVGVGVGIYSELLAQDGFKLSLIDITEKFVRITEERLKQAGLIRWATVLLTLLIVNSQLEKSVVGSALQLDQYFEPNSYDAVILLGPLYHLLTLEEREQCVQQSLKMLKKDGVIFAGGINRLAHLRDVVNGISTKLHNQFKEVNLKIQENSLKIL